MRRLIALDIDGTLKGPWGDVRPSSVRAVELARAAGVPTILATGRRVVTTLATARLLSVNLPLICYCGARVVDPVSEGKLGERLIPGDLAWSLMDGGRRARLGVAAYADDTMYLEAPAPDHELDAARLRQMPRVRLGEGVLREIEGWPLTALMVFGSLAVGDYLNHRGGLLGMCQAYHLDAGTARERLLILASGVDKAAVLAELCSELGIPRERVLAVGDSVVDAAMLRWAGMGVAMPESDAACREAADRIASPDEPDPVAAAIDDWLARDS
jgi:Cof subfamily protein (haloacid dehalogenase superfamily)